VDIAFFAAHTCCIEQLQTLPKPSRSCAGKVVQILLVLDDTNALCAWIGTSKCFQSVVSRIEVRGDHRDARNSIARHNRPKLAKEWLREVVQKLRAVIYGRRVPQQLSQLLGLLLNRGPAGGWNLESIGGERLKEASICQEGSDVTRSVPFDCEAIYNLSVPAPTRAGEVRARN
jgi:hypothetical protein